MSIVQDEAFEKAGLLRRLGKILSWVVAILLLVIGLISLLAPPELASQVLTLGVLLTGFLLLPPAVELLRERLGILKPFWAPPLAAVGMFLVTGIVSGLAAAPPSPPETPVKASPAPAPLKPADKPPPGSQSGW